jgi:hypothetical protein
MYNKCELVVYATENALKNLFEKYEVERPHWRPTSACEHNIEIGVGWTKLTLARVQRLVLSK